MSATHESTKQCPKCRAPLAPELTATSQPFVCANCGVQLQKKPRTSESHVESAAAASVEPAGILALAEDLLIRMITGVFRFILVKLPSEFYRAFLRWFPTLVRLIKVLILLGLWLAIVFGPLLGSLQREGRATAWLPYELPIPEFYRRNAALLDGLVLGYSAIAMIGSIWGALYVRRRHGRRATISEVS